MNNVITPAECRELAELLGIKYFPEKTRWHDGFNETFPAYPNFLDPVVVLREMRKKEDFLGFFNYLFTANAHQIIWNGSELMISISGISIVLTEYILDTTGKLALAALEWLRKEA